MCSLGCDFTIETVFDEPVGLEYVSGKSKTGGKLCAKGNYIFDLIHHSHRLIEPRTPDGPIPWRDAVSLISRQLAKTTDDGSVGLIMEGDVPVEDILAGRLFADKCAGSPWFKVRFATGDDTVVRAIRSAGVVPQAVDPGLLKNSEFVLTIGDPFEVSPVIAGPVLSWKQSSRRNAFLAVSPENNRTASFSSRHLRIAGRTFCADLLRAVIDRHDGRPVPWADTVKQSGKGNEISSVVSSVAERLFTKKSVIIVETQDPVIAGLAALVSSVVAIQGVWWLTSYGNAFDICSVDCESTDMEDIIGALQSGKMKTLIVLGSNLAMNGDWIKIRNHLNGLEFLVAGSPFESELTEIADLVLPTALWCETGGTLNGKFRPAAIAPPGAALSYGDIMRRLISNMGVRAGTKDIHFESPIIPVADDYVAELISSARDTFHGAEHRSTVISYGDGFISGMSRFMNAEKAVSQ